MEIAFSSSVKVVKIGSENQKAASGTTDIKWSMNLMLGNDGILGVKIKVTSTELKLKLEAFNDDTDENEKWEESINLSEVKIKYDDKDQQYLSFIKNLQNGLIPQELEIWRNEMTLKF